MASSRRRRNKPPEPRPVFFLDRSLGRLQVANAIRERGYEAVTLWDFYGDREDERINDEVWIQDGAEQGWILLAKDNVWTLPVQKAVILQAKAKVFFLKRGDLPGPTQVLYFTNNLNRIIQQARKPGPYGFVVYEHKIAYKWPR